MPEAFIIHRFKYKDNLTIEWWEKFSALNEDQLTSAKTIIADNKFTDDAIRDDLDNDVLEVLEFYKIQRDSH